MGREELAWVTWDAGNWVPHFMSWLRHAVDSMCIGPACSSCSARVVSSKFGMSVSIFTRCVPLHILVVFIVSQIELPGLLIYVYS
jgi:hypothetical protein